MLRDKENEALRESKKNNIKIVCLSELIMMPYLTEADGKIKIDQVP